MSVRRQLAADGVEAPMSVICRVLGVPRSTVYYSQRRRGPAPIDEVLARQIWRVIQECPAWGIRKVWGYLRNVVGVRVNRKKVARIMQIKGRTPNQRRPKMRPRVKGSRSVEFEERVGVVGGGRGSKREQVRAAVGRRVAPFRISVLERDCPGVSREMIRVVLRELKKEGTLVVEGRGPGARWRRLDGDR